MTVAGNTEFVKDQRIRPLGNILPAAGLGLPPCSARKRSCGAGRAESQRPKPTWCVISFCHPSWLSFSLIPFIHSFTLGETHLIFGALQECGCVLCVLPSGPFPGRASFFSPLWWVHKGSWNSDSCISLCHGQKQLPILERRKWGAQRLSGRTLPPQANCFLQPSNRCG